MANLVYEMDPVSHITADAIGTPGHRTFFIQAERGIDRVELLCEKQQMQALADAIDELVVNLEEEFGLVRHSDLTIDEAKMRLKEPVDPLFRVGAMGLGYDAGRDHILLVAQEVAPDDAEFDPREVRFFATRLQMQLLSLYVRTVLQQGRPLEQVILQAGAHARRNGHGE
ncbi:MAG: hypothetical protein QG637_489 [Chloroflexota bacterium]|nr:hypothetical protein [Chloroflexota bacterium]